VDRYKLFLVAVVAGGGYGKKSWKLYYNFIRWVITGEENV